MSNFVIAEDWEAGPQRAQSAGHIRLQEFASLALGASGVSQFLAELLMQKADALSRQLDRSRAAAPAEGAHVAWLDDVYSLVGRHEIDTALDVVFTRFDDLLSAGDWDGCDSVLRAIDIQRLDTHLLVGVLSATLPAKDKLTARDKLVERTERRLRTVEPDRVGRLLVGLR
jgi:hypothetical protein